MKKIITIGLMGLMLATGLTASEFTKCTGCHGLNGGKKALGKSLVINTMAKEDIIVALKGYKDGTYGGPMKGLMAGQVKNLTDEQINDLAVIIVCKGTKK